MSCSGPSAEPFQPPRERVGAVPEAQTGGQPPDPRPRREAGIGGLECRSESGVPGPPASPHRTSVTADPCQQGVSPQARQGSAAPTATPRCRATPAAVLRPPPACQPDRRASVPVALDPPPTHVVETNVLASQALLTAPDSGRCPRSSSNLRCPQQHVRIGSPLQCEGGPFRLTFSLENAVG